MHFSNDSGDFISPKNGASSVISRGANSTFTLEALFPNFDQQPKDVDVKVRGEVNLQSITPPDFKAQESYGFIDASPSVLPSQMRSKGFELSSNYSYDTHQIPLVSSVASSSFWNVSGTQLQENRKMNSSDNVVHNFDDRSHLQNMKLPKLHELEDDRRNSRVSLDVMHTELQNTLHQLKVLHAFPPGSNFEDEHSGLVTAILAMIKQLASLKDADLFVDKMKSHATNPTSASDLRDLVSRIFNAETNIPRVQQSTSDPLQSDSHFLCCSRNTLISSIRECVTKARCEWSAQYKLLEEQYLRSCQEIKTARHDAADAIQKATAQYKDADAVWETTHSQQMITIGNLREQLHNITVRFSNLQIESKSEQESQGKEFRQQISHLQGQVSALKQVAEKQTFHNSEETRRYEALSVEHDKLLQTLSTLPRRDERNEALSAENSKIQLILQQKQSDYDSLAFKYSNLQSHFDQQQTSFQQLISKSSSCSNEQMIELQGQNSELLANQQFLHDELIAISRSSTALDKENERLVQLFKEKLIEISAKDDEIRQHELFQLASAECESEKMQKCTSILLEAKTLYDRSMPGLFQNSEDKVSMVLEHEDLCDLIRSDMTIILDRQQNLEKTVQELRQRIKVLRTQAKVASSKAFKDTQDRICDVENLMDHTVDDVLKQHVLVAIDRAKSQLRDFNIAQEHNYVLGLQDINDCLHKEIMETVSRDRSLRGRVSAIFDGSDKNSGRR
jgi:hypothetical protein